jgi:transposase-like protein
MYNGTQSGALVFQSAGVGNPTFTTRSLGTKAVLSPTISSSAVDYAIGVNTNTQWYSVPTTAATHRFYAGTTDVMDIYGTTVSVNATANATSTSSAALSVSGGLAVANDIRVGGKYISSMDYAFYNLSTAYSATGSQSITINNKSTYYTLLVNSFDPMNSSGNIVIPYNGIWAITFRFETSTTSGDCQVRITTTNTSYSSANYNLAGTEVSGSEKVAMMNFTGYCASGDVISISGYNYASTVNFVAGYTYFGITLIAKMP